MEPRTLSDLLYAALDSERERQYHRDALDACNRRDCGFMARIKEELSLLPAGITYAVPFKGQTIGWRLDGHVLRTTTIVYACDIRIDRDDTGFPGPGSPEAAEFAAGPIGGRTPEGAPVGTDDHFPSNGVA